MCLDWLCSVGNWAQLLSVLPACSAPLWVVAVPHRPQNTVESQISVFSLGLQNWEAHSVKGVLIDKHLYKLSNRDPNQWTGLFLPLRHLFMSALQKQRTLYSGSILAVDSWAQNLAQNFFWSLLFLIYWAFLRFLNQILKKIKERKKETGREGGRNEMKSRAVCHIFQAISSFGIQEWSLSIWKWPQEVPWVFECLISVFTWMVSGFSWD